ncbi:DENN domain-containing protein 5B isoform X2 [Chrysoperla carnea]|uniref:DENN domain-containing protein 5B isoform X2 n=1 Tax=Chrysoperla carnea TaxID=189513 RepID=UPI001D0814EE|nr:DENN domain-containing protein 5B isoform X2 [Chrysoperla carnea]
MGEIENLDTLDNETSRFADYFVICGLDLHSGLELDRLAGDSLQSSPLERAYKTKVLGHYPENVTWNPFDPQAIGLLCLPAGLRFRTQKHSIINTPHFHSFVITREDGCRYYGHSLVFYEEVTNRDICNAMHTLQAMHITELSSNQPNNPPRMRTPKENQSRSLPRHFKLAVHNSAGALSYYDITKDKLYVTKSIALVSQSSYTHAAQMFLVNLYKCLPRRPTSNLSLESYVYNLLYEVSLPQEGRSVRIYLPPTEPSLPPQPFILQRPAPPVELPSLDFTLRMVFVWLGVDAVVHLFTCLLLEHQILLRSNDCQKLMIVAECMTSLLFPFIWPHVYVPILPISMHHFLDAPVPFLMGLYSGSENNFKVASEATLCYVDIDKPSVQLPEELPEFPHLQSFIAELTSALDKNGISISKMESVTITKSQQQHDNIMSTSCTLPSGYHHHARRKHSLHDVLERERPPSPPGSARNEALQRIADIVRRTGVALDKTDNAHPVDQYADDLKFNNIIREIFLNRFVHIFQSYEHFVILPNQDKQDWLNNRDTMQNFDKASFLSDQPEQHRPFLSSFLESQMFATLIDNKIMSSWGDYFINLIIFDHRIKLLRQRHGGETLVRSLTYEPCTLARETQRLVERRLANPDMDCPQPREVIRSRTKCYRTFPLLDADSLKPPDRKREQRFRSTLATIPPPANYRPVALLVPAMQEKLQAKQNELSPALIAQANWTFVGKLLKDCKSKTKRMLVAALGAEAAALGHGCDAASAVEESTLVSSLCDLLERVWAHSLIHRKGKSALWTHLLLYQEQRQNTLPSGGNEHNSLTPDVTDEENTPPSPNRILKNEQLPNLPDSLLFDMRNIQAMSDVKTHIGMARAWIRLALEKKQLSRHLRTLLSDSHILRSLYKRSAFLRSEDEREQFLYHLLSLNAVDYFCFTSTYPTTILPYRVIIFPSRKSGSNTVSANVWVVLSGSLAETKQVFVPRQSLDFVIHHKNLGVLTTMRIGHDNSGLWTKWMVEHVVVRNEVTGHTYKFPCGRWLGRGIDDGSTERLLVASLVPRHVDSDELVQSCKTPPRCRSPSVTRPELRPSEIQHLIGDCVNRIVKWHYRKRSDKNSSLTALLCGEGGLVHCLEQAFLCGFRSSRLFGRNLYLWDYFVRVKEHFEVSLNEESSVNNTDYLKAPDRATRRQSAVTNHEQIAVWRCYSHLMDEIQNVSQSLGKDGKFQLFICLGVREHLLHRMLVPMSSTRATIEMYEEQSFLRNRGLLTFLRQILEPLDELDVVLENSVTQGISSQV